MQKNLLGDRSIYNRYFGDFRGVDFSSDHTQVDDRRLAYMVNMYRDYRSGQGKALETIAGYRRRVELPEDAPVYGIHVLEVDGAPHVLLHAGVRLYRWHNYPLTAGVRMERVLYLPESTGEDAGVPVYESVLDEDVSRVLSVMTLGGEDITFNCVYEPSTHVLTVTHSGLAVGESLTVSYYEGEIAAEDALVSDMNERRSVSFVFNNRLYLLDGKHYLVYDGETVRSVKDAAYVPTTYINIIPTGENADIGTEYEQRNMLSPLFRHTFIADGENKSFHLNERDIEAVTAVKVYGEVLTSGYTVDLAQGIVTFDTAPQKPQDVTSGSYPEFYAGVEIEAQKTLTAVSGVTETRENIHELVTECTVAAVFDNRVFLTGNPAYPNHIFYCGRNLTGYVDPTYFGVLNYMQDGVGMTPNTGMIPVADTLMVLKSDTRQDGSVYFHSAVETGLDLQPKVYPSTQGLSGIGCLGACVNFLDDPVFVSRLGVEAVGQLSVRYERAVEHRSSLIDAKLVNAELSGAALEEWDGYLLLLVDGNVYMADSRQRYTHEHGNMQYEWFYLEGLGVYDGQYAAYRYSSSLWNELVGYEVSWCPVCGRGASSCTCGSSEQLIRVPLMTASAVYDSDTDDVRDLCGTAVNPPDGEGQPTAAVFFEQADVVLDGITYHVPVYYTVHEVTDRFGVFQRYEAYLCEGYGEFTGGVYRPACLLRSFGDNLYFGTESGVICSFNFDKRNEAGEIPTQYYSFDNRTILCGCATKMDNCGIPHLTKTTVKKSTVVKTRAAASSAAKIKVRTNRRPYAQIARINSARFSFEDVDFSDFSFVTTEQTLFAIREKEKKWVEKQYYLYSDEFLKPFALFYISYRYFIAGKYKE